jgi:hypothetical protein
MGRSLRISPQGAVLSFGRGDSGQLGLEAVIKESVPRRLAALDKEFISQASPSRRPPPLTPEC